ncbi:MAG: acetylglutamate kinase [Bryobacteraceae bacterium]
MRALVKLGGTLLDDAESRRSVCLELAEAVRAGHTLVAVHGGGRQMTRFLIQMGVESRFVEGLRVTTDETLDAVLKVFAGSVNKLLVSSLLEAGVAAVGLSGIDGALVEAKPLKEELGHVGRPVRSNPALLNCLLAGGFVPVVACVAGSPEGRIFNVNADQMAVACAAGFRPDLLLFLTDVDGVLDAEGNRIPQLDRQGIEKLISSGVAKGGMLAKLRAADEALEAGIPQVVIAPGKEPGVIGRVLAGESLGTRLCGGNAVV